jgi:hypothetical protein
MPTIGSTYRHYKGNEYRVLHVVKHSETQEEMVVYQDIAHPEKIWARPLPMFMETIEIEGKNVPRFTPIG